MGHESSAHRIDGLSRSPEGEKHDWRCRAISGDQVESMSIVSRRVFCIRMIRNIVDRRLAGSPEARNVVSGCK
jgi:hypothetical protein